MHILEFVGSHTELKIKFVVLINLLLFTSCTTAVIPAAFAGDIYGTLGNDNLRGTPRDDLIVGSGGNDLLGGRERDDIIWGDEYLSRNSSGTDGDDQLYGEAGNDELWGGMGDEVIMSGGVGDDQLYGGAGNDVMEGISGNDLLDGGPGDDIMSGGIGADQFNCGYGNDHVVDFNESEGDRIYTTRGDLGVCEYYPCPDGFARTTRIEVENQVQSCIDERTELGAMNASEGMDAQANGAEEPALKIPIVPALPPQQGGSSGGGGDGGAGPSPDIITGPEMEPDKEGEVLTGNGTASP